MKMNFQNNKKLLLGYKWYIFKNKELKIDAFKGLKANIFLFMGTKLIFNL